MAIRQTGCLLLCMVAPVYAAADSRVAAGEELYLENCARCHGEQAEGLQNYSGTLAQLSERLDGLTEGMPDFAGWFDEDEVEALHTFLTDAAGN